MMGPEDEQRPTPPQSLQQMEASLGKVPSGHGPRHTYEVTPEDGPVETIQAHGVYIVDASLCFYDDCDNLVRAFSPCTWVEVQRQDGTEPLPKKGVAPPRKGVVPGSPGYGPGPAS